jgi:hypothetical protein
MFFDNPAFWDITQRFIFDNPAFWDRGSAFSCKLTLLFDNPAFLGGLFFDIRPLG